MELLFFAMFLLLLTFLYLSLYILYKHKSKATSGTGSGVGAKLPPGERGWPFIGETLEVVKIARRGDPEKFIKDRINKFSSQVFRTSLFGQSIAFFCGAQENKFLFSNENKLVIATAPLSADTLIPKFLALRNPGRSFLKRDALRNYIDIMDVTARRHIETNWDNHKEVMVFSSTKNFALLLACRLFLGMDDPDQFDRLLHLFHILHLGLISIPINLPGTRFYRAIKASNLIRKELHAMIKQRKIDLAEKKASPMQDLLSHLLTSDENGVFMNETDIITKLTVLLMGGYDNVGAAITFTIKCLADHPHVYDQVLKEQMEITKLKRPGETLNWDDIQKMKYSWNVACEAMRLIPPVPGMFREAITDFTYAGFLIPKGWKLFCSAELTHKNPDYFPDPETFDPSRFEGKGPTPYTFIPFGGGPRICPGKEYARLAILAFMHNVVRKYKWEKSIPNEKIIYDILAAPANGLPVKLQPHNMH